MPENDVGAWEEVWQGLTRFEHRAAGTGALLGAKPACGAKPLPSAASS